MRAPLCCLIQVMEFLGQAAFSKAVQAVDIATGCLVCLKIIKNNKDYFDQSLDEVKLLRYINDADPDDARGILRLHDYFYYKARALLHNSCWHCPGSMCRRRWPGAAWLSIC
jgi:serine/threonine protein kinase